MGFIYHSEETQDGEQNSKSNEPGSYSVIGQSPARGGCVHATRVLVARGISVGNMLAARSRTTAGLGCGNRSKGIDALPATLGIGTGITRCVGEEMDVPGRIKLENSCVTSSISGFGVVDWWWWEHLRAVVLNIDDVCSSVTVGNINKFLLNAGIHEDGGGLPMGIRKRRRPVSRIALILGLQIGKVNDKNTDIPWLSIWHTQEVNVVLGKCHYRAVILTEIQCLDEVPWDGCRRGCFHCAHIETVQIAVGKGIEDICVVIQDGVERGIVERARSGGLSRPRLGTSIIDVDRIRVLCVSVQDVDGVEELGEVASRVCTVERRTASSSDVGRGGGSSPGLLSASIPILALETESEEVEVDVEGDTGRCADGGFRECEE